MRTFLRARTRRQLFRILAAGSASLPLVALSGTSSLAHNNRHNNNWTDKRDWYKPPIDCLPPSQHNCLLRGTKISTPRGDCPVEEFRIGDHVLTLNGSRPIKWIGKSRLTKTEGADWSQDVMPIRVAQFAIDDETPSRDLYVSPAHCLFIDDVLIPAMHLVNDDTIAPAMTCDSDTLEYYHLEFEAHEVIFAEDARVESYLGSNRESFTNFGDYGLLYDDRNQPARVPFAPIMGYHGGRDELTGLIRSIVSTVVDVRDPIQVAWDRLAARAQTLTRSRSVGLRVDRRMLRSGNLRLRRGQERYEE